MIYVHFVNFVAPDLSLFYKRYIYNVIVRYRLVNAKTSTSLFTQKTSTLGGARLENVGVWDLSILR